MDPSPGMFTVLSGTGTRLGPFLRSLSSVAALTAILLLTACGNDERRLRSIAPADSVIYIESPNLGALLRTLSDSPAFRSTGAEAMDVSALDGVEVAVAVSGFRASENSVTDDEAVLSFQPQFTLIGETHGWSWQVERLVDETLGDFVKGAYGKDARTERITRDGVDWREWTASDGRKAFAAISGSLVFFSNNEEGIRRTLEVLAGKRESLLSNESLSRRYEASGEKLAFGFVTEEGVRQLSAFAGISMAIDRADEADVQSVISSVLPQLIGNSVTEIVWTARSSDNGILDEIGIGIKQDIGKVFSETMAPAKAADDAIFGLVPGNAYSVTRYNLKNPRVAFRSLILSSSTKVDPALARFVPFLGASLLEPYGVSDPEGFLSSCEPIFLTLRFDEEGDESAAVLRIREKGLLPGFLSEELRSGGREVRADGIELIVSEAGDLAYASAGDYVILGSPRGVSDCLNAYSRISEQEDSAFDIRQLEDFSRLRNPEHTAVTISRDRSSPAAVAAILGSDGRIRRVESHYLVSTDFDGQGLQRTYLSPFGFAGSILEQLGSSR